MAAALVVVSAIATGATAAVKVAFSKNTVVLRKLQNKKVIPTLFFGLFWSF